MLDLSDEPVLGYRERMEVAAAVLAAGVVYEGPDFRFTPPAAEPAPDGCPDARRGRHGQANGEDRDRG